MLIVGALGWDTRFRFINCTVAYARFAKLISRVHTNLHAVADMAGVQYGSALYPSYGGLLNHSCEPNVLISCGDTSSVSFVAEGSLAAGDELCISYIDVDVDRKERQELLLHKYGYRVFY